VKDKREVEKEVEVRVEDWTLRTVWIERAEALRVCPISSTGLWRLQKSGAIRTTTAGRRVLFDLKSIEDYLEARATGGVDDQERRA
jgi:hypothetical protein